MVQQSFLDPGSSESLVFFLLIENQMGQHANLQTLVISTLGAGLANVRPYLTAVGQFASQRSLPVLGSPEKCPTGVASDGPVVFANFDIFD